MKIKSDTLRVFKVLHTWTGIIAGLLLFIAFYAGSITVFHEEIMHWQYADNQVPVKEALKQVPELTTAVTTKDPTANRGITVTLPGGHAPQLLAQWRSTDADIRHATINSENTLSFSNPSSSQLSTFIDTLHRNAGIPGLTGEWLMGIAALLYGLALISGVIIYLPVLSKDLFALRIGKNLKRLWLDVHNSIGIFSLPFHIIFALTGAVMSLHDPMLMAMNKLIYPDNGRTLLMQTIFPVGQPAAEGINASMLPTTELLKNIQRSYPDFQPSALTFIQPDKQDGVVSIMGDVPGVLAHRVRIMASSSNGTVLATQLPDNRPDGMTTLSSFFALHFADYGGEPVKWIYFLLGMAGAFLFYSGNLLWLEARRKRRQKEQAYSHRLLAGLTTGVCIGSCTGISAVFLISRWPEYLSIPALPLPSLYWCIFLLSLAWAFLRPPIFAARDLLLGLSFVTGLIPITSLLMQQNTGQLHGIDILALAASLIFIRFAYAANKRIKTGQENSVWANIELTK